MKIAKLNLIVDICAGIFCVISITTGFLQWFIYPHSGSGPKGEALLSHFQLYNLHLAESLIGLLFIVIHLALHLKWIQSCAGKIGKKSRQIQANFGADIAGTVCGLASLASGMVLWIVYPLGIVGKGRIFFLGHQYTWWYDFHFYASILFMIFVAVHLMLHWKWVKNAGRIFSC